VPISAATRYHNPSWSEAENLKIYGEDSSAVGMGYNYLLCFEVERQRDHWRDLTFLSHLVKDKLDHKRIYECDDFFHQNVPTLENLVRFCLQHFSQVLADRGFPLKQLTIVEGRRAWAKGTLGLEAITLYRSYPLHCLHRHHNPDLSAEENRELYGPCSRVHGHEYQFEVGLEGSVNLATGLLLAREQMDQWVHDTVIAPLDKTFFNDVIGNTSGEIICEKVFQYLLAQKPEGFKQHLSLRETYKNSFRWLDGSPSV
jgi:6-pyruvoyltetrahydropterin/6-carboxytetrahydropterin synthase